MVNTVKTFIGCKRGVKTFEHPSIETNVCLPIAEIRHSALKQFALRGSLRSSLRLCLYIVIFLYKVEYITKRCPLRRSMDLHRNKPPGQSRNHGAPFQDFYDKLLRPLLLLCGFAPNCRHRQKSVFEQIIRTANCSTLFIYRIRSS